VTRLTHEKPNFSQTVGKGGVIGNDVEWKRANMLQHQVQRIGSPGSACLNTDAQFFPGLKRENGERVKFDKVLCDVPCSGDGTIRKTPNIWRTWSTLKFFLFWFYVQYATIWWASWTKSGSCAQIAIETHNKRDVYDSFLPQV